MVKLKRYYEPEVVLHLGPGRVSVYSTVLFGPFKTDAQIELWQDLFLDSLCRKFGGKVIDIRPSPVIQRGIALPAPNYSPIYAGKSQLNFNKRFHSARLIVRSKKPFSANEDDFFDKFEIKQPIDLCESNLLDLVGRFPEYIMRKSEEAFYAAERDLLTVHEQLWMHH